MTDKPSPATADRVRFTIAVEPDVYDAFADLAQASGVSLSRCIGDWLRDTAEAAQMTTIKVNEVRRGPDAAFRAFLREVAFEIPVVQAKLEKTGYGAAVLPEGQRLRRGGDGSRGAARSGVPAQPAPPLSNTGGKVPQNARKPRP